MFELLLVTIRNFFVENFFVDIKCLYSNQKYYKNKFLSTMFYLFRFCVPFYLTKLVFGFFNYQIIYAVDGVHLISNIKTNHILPIILKFELEQDHLTCSNTKTKDITSLIKYYNSSLPLKYILDDNNLINYEKIKIKYINKGSMIEKVLEVNNVINLQLFKLFNQ